jgi:hypothetical protein
LRIAVLLIRGKIIVIFVHRGVGPSLFRGRSCAGGRSNSWHRTRTCRRRQSNRRSPPSSLSLLSPPTPCILCRSIKLTNFSQERRHHPNKHQQCIYVY